MQKGLYRILVPHGSRRDRFAWITMVTFRKMREGPGLRCAPQRVAVNIDAKKVQDAVAELAQREAAAGAKGTGR